MFAGAGTTGTRVGGGNFVVAPKFGVRKSNSRRNGESVGGTRFTSFLTKSYIPQAPANHLTKAWIFRRVGHRGAETQRVF